MTKAAAAAAGAKQATAAPTPKQQPPTQRPRNNWERKSKRPSLGQTITMMFSRDELYGRSCCRVGTLAIIMCVYIVMDISSQIHLGRAAPCLLACKFRKACFEHACSLDNLPWSDVAGTSTKDKVISSIKIAQFFAIYVAVCSGVRWCAIIVGHYHRGPRLLLCTRAHHLLQSGADTSNSVRRRRGPQETIVGLFLAISIALQLLGQYSLDMPFIHW